MNLLPTLLILISSKPCGALLCERLSQDAIAWMPKGWARGARRLAELLGCDGEGDLKKSTTEDFLEGMEHPGAYFRAELIRAEGEKVGFEVIKRSDYIVVGKIHDEGAAPKWNQANPPRALKPLDRIICVNGVEGNATFMAKELRRAASANLRVFRVHPDDRKALETRRNEKQARRALQEAGPPGLGLGIPEPAGSQVVVLHARNIEKYVQHVPLVLVMFYANWCGHCRQMAPDYTKAAHILSQQKDLGKAVKLAKFDDGDEANRYLAAGAPHKYNFTSYPAIKMFHNGIPEPYYGERTPNELASHVAAIAKGLDVETEVRKSLLKTRPLLYRPDTDPEVLLDLEPETYDDTVLKEYEGNNVVWIIEYYSDQCPICKSLKPEFLKASKDVASKLGKRVRFAGVNSRAFPDLAERLGVTSYPWVLSIYAGRKLEDMAGLGGAESVVDWATQMFKQAWKSEPEWSTKPITFSKKNTESSLAATPMFNNTGSWRELLGRRTWFLLHTLAAKYPEEPTAADQEAMRGLVAAMGQHYPCPICRKHLQVKLLSAELGPVNTQSRTALALWFCKLHNMVNTDLGHEVLPCNAFKLDLQYLKSCGECTASTAASEEASEALTNWDFFSYLSAGTHTRTEL